MAGRTVSGVGQAGAARQGPRRRGRSRAALCASATLLAAAATVLASQTAFAVGVDNSGFEDNDGNLASNSSTDWNSFSPVTWTGTAPQRVGVGSAAGWSFKGFEDFQKALAPDHGFAGGVKQDDNCAPVLADSNPPNKDDLKRIYLATKTGSNGHVYLNLAWVRIPQNSTTSSEHVGFEFNQSNTSCLDKTGNPALGGLVQRTGGDMLVVYDFGGGSDPPAIKISRWLTTAYAAVTPGTDTCEVNNSTVAAGCWGNTRVVSALNFAQGLVNTTAVGAVTDAIGPSGSESLGIVEFGEAGIDLTGAGVFSAGVCTAFGKAYGVTRSSGQSQQAAMEDIVGPGNFTLTNCGSVTFLKQDDLGNSLLGSVFTLYRDIGTVPGAIDAGDAVYTVATTLPAAAASGATTLSVVDAGALPSAGRFVLGVDSGSNAENVTVTSRSGNTLTLAAATTKAHASGVGVSWAGTCGPSGTPATCTIPNLPFGSYVLRETTTPTGYTTAADKAFAISQGSPTFNWTFVDNRAPINITINKKDDASPQNTLPICSAPSTTTSCAVFALYQDNATVGTFDSADTHLAYCIPTAVAGQCRFTNVYPGNYFIDEVQVPTGYAKDSTMPLAVTVVVGDTNRTYNLTDPRLFKVITIVCKLGTSKTLYGSTVAYGTGSGQTTLKAGATLPGTLTEDQLCGLGGATLGNVQHSPPNYTSTITIPTTPIP